VWFFSGGVSHKCKVLGDENKSDNVTHNMSVETSDDTHEYSSEMDDETAISPCRNDLRTKANGDGDEMPTNATNGSVENTVSATGSQGLVTNKPSCNLSRQNGRVLPDVPVSVNETDRAVSCEITGENGLELEVSGHNSSSLSDGNAAVSGRASGNGDGTRQSDNQKLPTDDRQTVDLLSQSNGINNDGARRLNGDFARHTSAVSPKAHVMAKQNRCSQTKSARSASIDSGAMYGPDSGRNNESDGESTEPSGYSVRSSANDILSGFTVQSTSNQSAAATSEGSDSLSSRQGACFTRVRRLDSAATGGELNFEVYFLDFANHFPLECVTVN
jgi:hypothetical protein